MTVPRETLGLLARYEQLVRDAGDSQNLVAKSTFADFHVRHVEDSLQLLKLIPAGAVTLLDVGSGAGLPGLVLACTTSLSVCLLEPRRLRAEFLSRAVTALGLEHRVSVAMLRAEQLNATPFDVITARAVAPLDKLFAMTAHLAGPSTLWLLPKGRTAAAEVAQARPRWSGRLELVASVTDPEAAIVVAEGRLRT